MNNQENKFFSGYDLDEASDTETISTVNFTNMLIIFPEGGFWRVGRLGLIIPFPKIKIDFHNVFRVLWFDKYINWNIYKKSKDLHLGPITIRIYDTSTNNNYYNQQEKDTE